jgi:hypothetical protein
MRVHAVLIAASLALLLGVTGCGGGSDDGTPEDALESYLSALADGDAEAACELLGSEAADTSLPQPDCESEDPAVPDEAVEFGDGEVSNVEESGGEATADVTPADGGDPQTVDLVEEDGAWRVDGFAIADIEI